MIAVLQGLGTGEIFVAVFQLKRRYTAASAGMFGVTGTAKHRIFAKSREL